MLVYHGHILHHPARVIVEVDVCFVSFVVHQVQLLNVFEGEYRPDLTHGRLYFAELLTSGEHTHYSNAVR